MTGGKRELTERLGRVGPDTVPGVISDADEMKITVVERVTERIGAAAAESAREPRHACRMLGGARERGVL